MEHFRTEGNEINGVDQKTWFGSLRRSNDLLISSVLCYLVFPAVLMRVGNYRLKNKQWDIFLVHTQLPVQAGIRWSFYTLYSITDILHQRWPKNIICFRGLNFGAQFLMGCIFLQILLNWPFPTGYKSTSQCLWTIRQGLKGQQGSTWLQLVVNNERCSIDMQENIFFLLLVGDGPNG
jgi:hypothetical protein